MPGRLSRGLVQALKQVPVTITAGATAGVVQFPAGCKIVVSVLAAGNQDQAIKSVVVSAAGVTITLAAAATANNTLLVTFA